jgi:hypothetical protein
MQLLPTSDEYTSGREKYAQFRCGFDFEYVPKERNI